MPNSKSVVKALPSQVTVLPNGNAGIGTSSPKNTLDVNGQLRLQSTVNNAILRASFPNTYGWKLRTIDRGNGVDLDIIGTDGSDIETDVLSLSIGVTGRVPRWNGYPLYHAGNSGPTSDISLSATVVTVANTWKSIANVNSYNGTYILQIRFATGNLSSGAQVYWWGHISGVISLSEISIYFNAPEELLTVNHSFHERRRNVPTFKLDKINDEQYLFMKSPTDDAINYYDFTVKLRQMIA
jgi:hypothetical protein